MSSRLGNRLFEVDGVLVVDGSDDTVICIPNQLRKYLATSVNILINLKIIQLLPLFVCRTVVRDVEG